MKKWSCLALAALLFALFALPTRAAGSTRAQELAEAKADVLLIYEDPTQVKMLESLVTALGKTVFSVRVSEYTAIQPEEFDFLLLLAPDFFETAHSTRKPLFCIGKGFTIPGVETQRIPPSGIELKTETFYEYLVNVEEMEVITRHEGEAFFKIMLSFDREAPFAVGMQTLYYAPHLDENDISPMMLGQVMAKFLSGNSRQTTPEGKIYLIVKDVFAFSDLDMLCRTADELYLANIPFIVKVMPLYSNTDLPAFARYTQALRYVESRNGAIVMSPPLMNGKAGKEEIEEMTRIATKALMDEGVTVLPSVEGFYLVTMEDLISVKSPFKYYESFSFDVGIVENLPESDLQLKQMAANLNGRWYAFGDYREKHGLESLLYLETPFDEAYENAMETQETSLFFMVGNDIILIVVSVLLCIMLCFIVFNRKIYHKKFAKK